MKIILASSSPRRAEVLHDAGIAFEIRATPIDESGHPGESGRAMVERLAEAKARAVAEKIGAAEGACIVIGADTTVELDGEFFGKPRDAVRARHMLAVLSGRTHHVLTGIFLMRLPDGAARAAVETTSVTFVPLGRREIDDYIASGEPMDKAGGYGIQGVAGRYISGIEGCYFNVVGLPLARLHALLRDLGWQDES